jgi:addiction module RelE/StbE family toxin
MWELRYDPRVRKQLERIKDKRVIKRLEESALRLKDHPYLGKGLEGYPDLRSYRVGTPGGEYRIIYCLMEADHVIFIILIASREEVYHLLKRRFS